MEKSLLQKIVPAEKLGITEKALLDTFGNSDLSDIVPVKGGLSGALVYKIEVDNKSYILKVDRVTDIVSGSKSFYSQRVAALAGIAPKVHYLNVPEGISITSFIEHVPLRVAFDNPELLLAKLAKTIRTIHEIPLFEKEKDLFETVNGLVTSFRESGMLAGPSMQECFNFFDVISQHYPWNDTDNVSSHNDLNPSNITCDGKNIWVIDWDAASQNDRYVDLAIASNFFVHTDEQENHFLEKYFGTFPNEYQRARFFLMRQICRIIYALLMFKLADKIKPAGETHDGNMQTPDLKEIGEQMRTGIIQISSYEGQLLYGKAMINESLKNMRLPRFNSSIEIVALAG